MAATTSGEKRQLDRLYFSFILHSNLYDFTKLIQSQARNLISYLKGTAAIQQYQSRIRVFFNLYLHQQLKFDNSLYIIHTK